MVHGKDRVVAVYGGKVAEGVGFVCSALHLGQIRFGVHDVLAAIYCNVRAYARGASLDVFNGASVQEGGKEVEAFCAEVSQGVVHRGVFPFGQGVGAVQEGNFAVGQALDGVFGRAGAGEGRFLVPVEGPHMDLFARKAVQRLNGAGTFAPHGVRIAHRDFYLHGDVVFLVALFIAPIRIVRAGPKDRRGQQHTPYVTQFNHGLRRLHLKCHGCHRLPGPSRGLRVLLRLVVRVR